jgi:hypothetical protein
MVWPLQRLALWRWWQFGYLPLPLPFAPLPTDIREWPAETDPTGLAMAVPFHNGDRIRASLHRILIEAGIALTPATSVFDPRSWFALYRYGADFAGTAPRLRLYSGAAQKDPRHTGVCAEEVSTGITCYVLHEHLGLDHIADAYALVQSGDLEYVNPPSEERPDYFCLDYANEAVLAESKGAVGTRSRITRRIDPEGWGQLQNVRPLNHPLRAACGRVIVGTHVCIDGQHGRSETTTILKDPVGERGANQPSESDMPIRVSYAKALRFAGADIIADALLLRRRLTSTPLADELEVIEVDRFPLVIVGLSPMGDLVCMLEGIVNAFGKPALLTEAIPPMLDGFRERRRVFDERGVGFGLPNGVVVLYPIPGAWEMLPGKLITR